MRNSHTTTTQQHTTRWKPRLSTVIALTGLLALTGCATTTPPQTTSSPSTIQPRTSPTTTSPSTTAPATTAAYQPATANGPAQNVPVPTLPTKATEFSKEGLLAFAEYWYTTLGYAFETGDPEPMMAISDPSCRICEAMQETVVAGHSGGKWIVGGKMIVDAPYSSFVLTPDGTYQAIIMARQEQVKYFRADKTLSKNLGIDVAEADILIGRYADGKWIAITVEHLAGSKAS